MNRHILALTWGLLLAALAISVALLIRPDTPAELVGSIWTIWGGTVLVTAINFWFGSSAGKGRNIEGHAEDKGDGDEPS